MLVQGYFKLLCSLTASYFYRLKLLKSYIFTSLLNFCWNLSVNYIIIAFLVRMEIELKRNNKPVLPILCAVILVFSCKTNMRQTEPINPFGIIGNNADIYVYLPVATHRPIAEKALPQADNKNMKAALNRTQTIYSGVFVTGRSAEIRICAIGSYPHTLTDSLFTKKKGWTKKLTADAPQYKYYESAYTDISIPAAAAAIISMGAQNRQKMTALLARIKTPEPLTFSNRFAEFIRLNSEDIGVFINNSNAFLSQIFGVNLGLPVGNMELYLKKDRADKESKAYLCNFIMETENGRSAAVIKLFLQKKFKTEARLEDNTIIIENAPIDEQTIISIIKSLYPN